MNWARRTVPGLFLIKSVLHLLVTLMLAVISEELHFHTLPDICITHLFHCKFKHKSFKKTSVGLATKQNKALRC